jgi:multimeric flavodoxin WrbA
VQVIVVSVTPEAFLDRLLPYLKHRSEKVRGTVAATVASVASRMSAAAVGEYGVRRLLAEAGSLIIDKSPEARRAVRQLVPLLKAAVDVQSEEKENQMVANSGVEGAAPDAAWQTLCSESLSLTARAAVEKVLQ